MPLRALRGNPCSQEEAPSFPTRPTPAPGAVLCGWGEESAPCCPDLSLKPNFPISPGRFVPGLTLTFPHCVPHTVMHSCVLRCETVQL